MEEVIETLRERNVDVSVTLELPSEDDLVKVEEEILIPLPGDLRTYLLEASDVICGRLEPVTAVDPRSHTYLPEVCAQAWDIGLPREYIPVCELMDGYACIAQDGKVHHWSREQGLEEEWEDFWDWCSEVWLEER